MRIKDLNWCLILLIYFILFIEINAKKTKPKVRKFPNIQMSQELMDAGKICEKTLKDRIVGGVYGPKNAFPWLVAMYRFDSMEDENSGVEYFGTGSLISKNYVLMAAHNTQNSSKNQMFVRIGDFNLMSPDDDQERGVVNRLIPTYYIFNQTYTGGYGTDVALLKLNVSVEFSKFIQPICIPGLNIPDQELKRNDLVGAAGWGGTENSYPSAYIKSVEMFVMDMNVCELVFDRNFDADKVICTRGWGPTPKATLFGDSGGPLMPYIKKIPEPIIIGVVSGGEPGHIFPSTFTKISIYAKWIAETAI